MWRDGVELEPEPEPPLHGREAARVRALARDLAVHPRVEPSSNSPLPTPSSKPFVELEPVAVKGTAPVTVRERFVVAVTACVASVTATAAPTAAVEAAADPDAVVVTEAVCVAATVSAPPSVVATPVPIDASVVTVESETATDGAIATPPPAAPPVGRGRHRVGARRLQRQVVPVEDGAVAERGLRRVGDEVDRHRGADAEPVAPAVDFALDVLTEVALKVASVAGALNGAGQQRQRLHVRDREGERAGNAHRGRGARERLALVASRRRFVASTSTDPADAVPAIDASLTMLASVIATPAPIAAEPPVAEPSAFEAAAAVSDDVTVSAPPTARRLPTASPSRTRLRS